MALVRRPARGPPMDLSICLLTRNEEANLPRVLGSVAGLGAEVVVADTGSTDRTAAVAAELGAKVVSIAWDDDFSAGRNAALAAATGERILWLNPDEELSAASDLHVRLCLVRDDVFAVAVRVQALLRADQPAADAETLQVRLFRRRPEVRYVGRLHPEFAVPLEDLARREGK